LRYGQLIDPSGAWRGPSTEAAAVFAPIRASRTRTTLRSLLRVADGGSVRGMPSANTPSLVTGDASKSVAGPERTSDPLVSVVAPVFDEAATIGELHRRLTATLAPLGRYELVIVDDGSTDGTWETLRALAQSDPHLSLLRLSRNFGHQIALSAGLDHARGDAIISIDGDLQDPPEAIPALIERWRDGADVVFAVRQHREGETWFKLATAAAFYKLINRVSSVGIPEQAGDFRLLSRRALDALLTMPESARYLRGMSSWIGFRQAEVGYAREPRHAGTTKYPIRRMLHFAGDAVTSFSATPIRLVAALGFASVALCLIALAWSLYVRILTDDTVAGWTSVIVVVLFIGGVQLLSLGIIGQYVGRIFDEVKRRPLYFVDEVVGFDDGSSADRLLLDRRGETVGGEKLARPD
jgi:polyisoprenyl-phosphate glycosyltransferase